jgi:ParB-like nuclease domain
MLLKKTIPTSIGKTEDASIDSVRQWKDNPRENDDAAPKLAELLKIHGQVTPIVCWTKNRTIYKGNTTWKAAKILGWKTIRVLWVNFTSDAAATAYAIADNKSSEFAQWDEEILQKLLNVEDVQQMRSSGFSEEECNLLKFLPKDKDLSKIADDYQHMLGKTVVIISELKDAIEIKNKIKNGIFGDIKILEVK